MNLLCFAGQDWRTHGRAHSDFQLCTEVARAGNPTLIVNSIGMRMPVPGKATSVVPRIARKLRSTLDGYRRPFPDVPELAVLSPLIAPAYGSERARKVNATMVATQARLGMKHHGMSRPTCIVSVPTAIDVAERLDVEDLFYYRADAHSEADDIDVELIRSFEDRLFASASVVFYSSDQLLEAERDRHHGPVHFLDHGVDAELFRPDPTVTEPADLASIPRPRAGFFGAIERTNVDVDLLVRLAQELSEVQMVFIGRHATNIDQLERQPNVHMLGWRDHESIPAYAQGFDVALLPRPRDKWNEASNPIKLKEYLAMGLPVVSSPVPALSRYAPYVTEAKDAASFIEAVATAVGPGAYGTPQERRDLVIEETWKARAHEMMREIERKR